MPSPYVQARQEYPQRSAWDVTRAGMLALGGVLLLTQPGLSQIETEAVQVLDFSPIVESVSPAVVSIQVLGEAPVTAATGSGLDFPNLPPNHPLRPFFEEFAQRLEEQQAPPPTPVQGVGSGFFISGDGYVVTNYHVVADATEVTVVTETGQEYPVEVVGTDMRTDLAVLKADVEEVPYVEFADEADVNVGQWVVAVGNPFGLGGTVTAGIVSALGRSINASAYDDFIQIDAAVNRGNSGGPAFDLEGRVVGVNTAIFSPTGANVGIAFAIPAGLASEIVADLQEDGVVSRGYLGVALQLITEAIAEEMGFEGTEGALVAQVPEGSPADEAGIVAEDIIVELNGDPVEDSRTLAREIARHAPGDNVTLTIWRDGEELEVDVSLAELPGEL